MSELANGIYNVFNCLLVTVILARHHYGDRLRPLQRRWTDRGLVLVGLLLVLGTIVRCWRNIVDPQAWDYPMFYAIAKAAVSGRSFYRIEVLRTVFREVRFNAAVPDDWLSWKGIGYWYLPPSALLLAPFGVFSYTTSLTLHYLAQSACLAASAALIHRMAPIAAGWRGRLDTIVLMLAFRPVQDVFQLAQIVFGALFFVTLAFYTIDEQPVIAGIALGVGFLCKHLVLIAAGLTLCIRRYSAALAAAATVGAAMVGSAWVFGAQVFSDYNRYGPSANPAQYYFSGPLNRSLFATIYRTFGVPRDDISLSAALLSPRFALVAGLMTLITAALCWRETRNPAGLPLKMSLILGLALLISPFTLYHTVALILPVFFVLYAHRDRLPVPGWAVIVFIGLQYAFGSIHYAGSFAVLLSTWVCTAAVLLEMTARERRSSAPALSLLP